MSEGAWQGLDAQLIQQGCVALTTLHNGNAGLQVRMARQLQVAVVRLTHSHACPVGWQPMPGIDVLHTPGLLQ